MRTTTIPGYERRLLRHSTNTASLQKGKKIVLFRNLQLYIEKQKRGEYRFKWAGITMVVQAVLITPFIALVIMQTGNHAIYWFLCTATTYLTFIPILSGLSVKAILSAFFISILINIAILVTAIAGYLFF